MRAAQAALVGQAVSGGAKAVSVSERTVEPEARSPEAVQAVRAARVPELRTAPAAPVPQAA